MGAPHEIFETKSLGALCWVLTSSWWTFGPFGRGKVMSQKANKLQAPILDNLIYSRRPFLKKVINSSEMTINSCER